MTQIPMMTGQHGGPSVLSDDTGVYTAIVLSMDSTLYKDIKFTRTDASTGIQTVLFRKDFAYYNEPTERMTVPIEPLMALGFNGTLYYLEYYTNYSSYSPTRFLLMKVNFLAETIEKVYEYTYEGYEGNVWYKQSNFMIVVRDENSQEQYLVWDIVKKKDFMIYYTSSYVWEEAITNYDDGPTVCCCFGSEVTMPLFQNEYHLDQYTGRHTLTGPEKIDYYVMNLFAEGDVEYFTVWENTHNSVGGDNVEFVNLVPSPIIYKDENGTTNLYIVYGVNGDSCPLFTWGDPFINDGYFLTCTSVNEYLICPKLYSYTMCSCWLDYGINNKEKRAYYEEFVFKPYLFFFIIKADIVGKTAIYKEISNNRNITFTLDDDRTPSDTDYGETVYRPPEGWGCFVTHQASDCAEDYWYEKYVDIIPGSVFYGASQGNIWFAQAEVHSMRPYPLKVVFDRNSEIIYIKVGNPDNWSIDITDQTPSELNEYQLKSVIDAQTMGIIALNIAGSDLNDYSITTYPRFKDVFDLTMDKQFAYRVSLDDSNIISIYRLSDGALMTTCGEHNYLPNTHYHYPGSDIEYKWEDTTYGMKLSQQPSTDEGILWKLVPAGSGGIEDTEMKLIGHSVTGGTEKTLTMVAPFIFNDLIWYNVHQHDGKIVLTTGDGSVNPPLIGVWLIK